MSLVVVAREFASRQGEEVGADPWRVAMLRDDSGRTLELGWAGSRSMAGLDVGLVIVILSRACACA